MISQKLIIFGTWGMKPKVVISNHAIYVRDEPVILKVTNLHFPQNKNINFKIVASSFEQDILNSFWKYSVSRKHEFLPKFHRLSVDSLNEWS